eukprot:TRINITY_DN6544_c0_g1_i1.p1 TRINITY_DN6544_c0_g1~~TRINITY_DN6544_c0_g1_i1.p1  ORF type:complete len:599 (+),score=82.58 TRINITY_DN6544_c0_g1_i1:27-1799(+)
MAPRLEGHNVRIALPVTAAGTGESSTRDPSPTTPAEDLAQRSDLEEASQTQCCEGEANLVVEVIPNEASRNSLKEVKKEQSRRLKFMRHTNLGARWSVKFIGLGMMAVILILAVLYKPTNVIDDDIHHRRVMTALFVAGLTLVALEDWVVLNKAGVMIILAGVMWTFHAVKHHPNEKSEEGHAILHHKLEKGLAEVGSIILFLLPAMGLVESIDHFDGFAIVTRTILRYMGKRPDLLMPIIFILSFFLSSVMDNLTATIVCLKILRHVVPHNEDWRHSCGGLTVVSANAGGAWSPIGDVTTTMLWIQNKITAAETVKGLFIPSFVAGVVPLCGIWWQACRCGPGPAAKDKKVSGEVMPTATSADQNEDPANAIVSFKSIAALVVGVGLILLIPVLKIVTGLPPYLGMLLALGIFWVITDCFNFEPPLPSSAEDSQGAHGHGEQGVTAALHKVDLSSLLFFTGVLLSVVALESAGVLKRYSSFLVEITGHSQVALSILLGVSSAIVDNVPLVQAAIEMFDETPVDDSLWQLVALASGTGGSILAVGSVAGVTLMGMEGVSFIWYAKRISLWAALGFMLAVATYELQHSLVQ